MTLPLPRATTPTRVLGGETATRRLDRDRAQTEYRPAPSPTRRPPRAPPSPPPPPPAAPAAAPRSARAFSRFVRFVLALVALVLIAAAVAAAVIVATDKAAGVRADRGRRRHGRQGRRRSQGTGQEEHRIGARARRVHAWGRRTAHAKVLAFALRGQRVPGRSCRRGLAVAVGGEGAGLDRAAGVGDQLRACR